jgi:hypothetical protein
VGFDEIEVTDGWLSMVRPKKEIAPLLAAQVIQAAEESVRYGGPDRSPNPPVFVCGIGVESLDELLALAEASR